jgi:hypothetical protein
MDLQDVKAFLAEHEKEPEVAEFVKGMAVISPEVVSGYLQTGEGKALIQPMLDQRVTDAIKTHDEKSKAKVEAAVKAGIAAEMLRLNPQETPAEKRLREVEDKLRLRDEEMERERINGKIRELAHKEGIRPEFLEHLNFSTVEGAESYFKVYKAETESIKASTANELARGMPKPGMGSGGKKKPDIASMSQADLIKMEMAGALDEAMTG